MRLALGLSYLGHSYCGWQSQANGASVQDALERALADFATQPVRTSCAGRTDTGVHALQQVVHFDTNLHRDTSSWVRGTNRYLPPDIAVQWAREVPDRFHSRASAQARRYSYLLLQSPVRPSLEHGRVGWVFRPLDGAAMQQAADLLLGTHDFSSFRASACQAPSPVKTLARAEVQQCRSHAAPAVTHAALDQANCPITYWRFEFEADAFLHHMIRNIMGCLVQIGQGAQPAQWMRDVLLAHSRRAAAPTFASAGLYFCGPVYDPVWQLPGRSAAFDWLPS